MPSPSDLPPPPVKTSKVRAGLRVFAWLLPGLCAPGFAIIWLLLAYSSSDHIWAVYAGLIALTLICSFVESTLRIAPPQEEDHARTKRFRKHILLFTLLQLPIIPALGSAIFFGCVALF